MAMNNLTKDGEFRYVVQWFNEWSELQREDFVPIMVDYLKQPDDGEGLNESVYMNGLVNTVMNTSIDGKPMSLFQCRIKLFRQWNAKWPKEFKHKLKEKIIEIDIKVGEKIMNELKMQQNCTHINGNSNGNDTEDTALTDANVEEGKVTEENEHKENELNEVNAINIAVGFEDTTTLQVTNNISDENNENKDVDVNAVSIATIVPAVIDTVVQPVEQVQMPIAISVTEVESANNLNDSNMIDAVIVAPKIANNAEVSLVA